MENYKKSAVKLGLFYGAMMGLLAGLLGLCLFPALGCFLFRGNIILGLILGVLLDVIAAVLFGVFCGLVYGLIMGSVMEKNAKDFAPTREAFMAQRRLFYDGPANHQIGKESVGGWMFVLNDTLYFKAHQQNVQVHELQIPLANIRKVMRTKRFIYNTGLDIELADGTVEKYVVNEQKIWAAKITEACHRVGNHIHA